ncbi:MAG: 30S ribosomal protein S16 [Salibacteraceae bacterium]
MSTRIRLQRHGKKGKPFFHIVVADQRSKRDGRFIEKLGIYNPNTNPATIDLDFERSLHWVTTGAQPSDTARAILSYKGVLMKEHLMRGVTKGALTEQQAEAKFQKWMEEKHSKIESKKSNLTKGEEDDRKARLEAERAVNEARAASLVPPQEEVTEGASEAGEAIADAAGQAVEAVTDAAETVAEKVEEAVEEVKETLAGKEEETAKEEGKAESKEPAKEETKAEVKEEAKEEPKQESKAEAKDVDEAKAEDDKKEDSKKEG